MFCTSLSLLAVRSVIHRQDAVPRRAVSTKPDFFYMKAEKASLQSSRAMTVRMAAKDALYPCTSRSVHQHLEQLVNRKTIVSSRISMEVNQDSKQIVRRTYNSSVTRFKWLRKQIPRFVHQYRPCRCKTSSTSIRSSSSRGECCVPARGLVRTRSS